jgi:hypothetical protein
MMSSAVAGEPLSVAKTTLWPCSVKTCQLTATSVGSKSRSGIGINTLLNPWSLRNSAPDIENGCAVTFYEAFSRLGNLRRRAGSPTSQVTGVPACQPRSDDAELRLVAVDRHDAVLLLDLIVAIQYALPLEAGYRLELLLCERPIGVFANAGRLRRVEQLNVIARERCIGRHAAEQRTLLTVWWTNRQDDPDDSGGSRADD